LLTWFSASLHTCFSAFPSVFVSHTADNPEENSYKYALNQP
jgi:hypothetical protein